VLQLFAHPPTPWEDLLNRNLNELVGTFLLKSDEWIFTPAYENKVKDEFKLNFLNAYFEFAFYKVPIGYLPLAIPAMASCLENWLSFIIKEKLNEGLIIQKISLPLMGFLQLRLQEKKTKFERLIREAESMKIITKKGKEYLDELRKVRNDFIHLNYEELSKGILLKEVKDPVVRTLNIFWEKGIEGIKGFLVGGVDSEFLDFVKRLKE
jgi:hypothetical protein